MATKIRRSVLRKEFICERRRRKRECRRQELLRGVSGEGSLGKFLKLDFLKRHFLCSLDQIRISLHMTGMIICFQLYELHKGAK